MEAVVLHRRGKKVSDIIEGCRKDNIMLREVVWDPLRSMETYFLDTPCILVCGDNPDYSILKAVAQLRESKRHLPIIFLDEVETPHIAQSLAAAGVALYAYRPFDYRDLTLTIKKLIYKREAESILKRLYAYGVQLDLDRRCARREQHIVALPNKEFELLEFFIMNRGKVITRTTLLENVWDRNSRFSSNTLDVHINRLRRKLDHPFKEKLIHTVHNIGYRFERMKV